MARPKLYYAPGSIAVAIAIAMREEGIAFDPVPVDNAGGEQRRPGYLAINPKGRVPSLVTDHGTLTETIAILEYACPGLIPTDPWQAARMRELNTYLATTAHVNHAHKMRGHRWANAQSSWEDMTAKVPETMTESAAYLESKIAGPLALGDTLTLTDPYLYVIAHWMPGDEVELAAYPKLSAFMAAMDARDSVQRIWKEGYLP